MGKPKTHSRTRAESGERGVLALQQWCQEILDRGEWGPTPHIAAKELGCSPALVKRLADEGILVRNEYSDSHGLSLIVISVASIQAAKLRKAKYGTYSGRPSHRPSQTTETK